MISPSKKRKYVDALKPLPVSGEQLVFCLDGRVCLNALLIARVHFFNRSHVHIVYTEDATSKRQMIVKEIFETEYNYISQLNTINNVRLLDRNLVGVSEVSGCKI